MNKILLLLLAVTSNCYSLPTHQSLSEQFLFNKLGNLFNSFTQFIDTEFRYSEIPQVPFRDLKKFLHKEAPTLSQAVINKVLTTLQCANRLNIDHNDILTVIDYSLPSSEKRLWVFDLQQGKLLFHTYVSHGIKSGALQTRFFSNKYNSKASSLGVYTTDETYQGREGLSLRLTGLDKGFNDNANNRYIVMHGGWYVDENFIKKYGRPGRSWGCPAIPKQLTQPLINIIKDKSLFVVYYPSDHWFAKSKFLNCNRLAYSNLVNRALLAKEDQVLKASDEQREPILFADLNKNNKHEENEPVIVISADNYERIYNKKAPLERMLRRQINHVEYIALTEQELETLTYRNENLNDISFIIPVLKMKGGYYETQFQIMPYGRIKEIRYELDDNPTKIEKNYKVVFEKKSDVNLRITSQFIRWLGL